MPRCFMAKKLKYPYQNWKQQQRQEEEEEEEEEAVGEGLQQQHADKGVVGLAGGLHEGQYIAMSLPLLYLLSYNLG